MSRKRGFNQLFFHLKKGNKEKMNFFKFAQLLLAAFVLTGLAESQSLYKKKF